jgi:Uma2 family endonuclease
MVSSAKTSPPEPEYAWDIARLYPPQGMWSEGEYLYLTNPSNNPVEFTDGRVEVLAMPKMSHQLILAFLYDLLSKFVRQRDLGKVLFAALRVRLRPGMIREPDIVFMKKEHVGRMGEDFWEGADLVMEIVSEGAESRRRDFIDKRREYAQGKIPEYWIVDPQEQRITVLRLNGSEYIVHGEFAPGQIATSALLPGFVADVAAVFNAAK